MAGDQDDQLELELGVGPNLGLARRSRPGSRARPDAWSEAARWGVRDNRPGPYDRIPDVRDGLTRVERVVLWVLHESQREMGGRYVSTAMLYGRVVEHVNISVGELQAILARMGAGS